MHDTQHEMPNCQTNTFLLVTILSTLQQAMMFEEISIILRIVYLNVEGVQLDEQCRCSRSISGIPPVD